MLRIFLQLKDLYDHDEARYPISKIYLNDYCVWLQSSSYVIHRETPLQYYLLIYSNQSFKSLSKRMEKIGISKSHLSWPLEEYEKLAREIDVEESPAWESGSSTR